MTGISSLGAAPRQPFKMSLKSKKSKSGWVGEGGSRGKTQGQVGSGKEDRVRFKHTIFDYCVSTCNCYSF